MSTASRLRHPKQPSPESGRPRLRGERKKPAPLDITEYSKMLHGMSEKQSVRNAKTRGAFGGCTRDERALRSIKRRLSQ